MPPNNLPSDNNQESATHSSVASPSAPSHSDVPMHVPHKPNLVAVLPNTQSAGVVPLVNQPIPPTQSVAKSIEEEIEEKETALKKYVEERLRIEEDSQKLFSERKILEEKIAPILEEERLSVERISELEKTNSSAKDPGVARAAERDRWTEEEKRRGIERRKWQIGEELESVSEKIKESERTFKLLSSEEEGCAMAIEQLHIKMTQRGLEQELEVVGKDRSATEAELSRLSSEHERLEGQLRDMAKREKDAVLAESAVDRKKGGVSTIYEEQVLAGERHKLEDERKSAEQKRWEAEDAIPPVLRSEGETQKHLDEIKKKESIILDKLDSLNQSGTSA